MKYLINELKPKGKAHLWSDAMQIEGIGEMSADTYCHIWTTGGLKRDRAGWAVVDETGKEICTMCKNNWGKQYQ